MSHIWVPKAKIIEPQSEVVLASRVQGFYQLFTQRKGEPRRARTPLFPNLILNSGLDRIGVGSASLLNCQVGTGSALPAATDTTLQSRVASTSSITATNRTAKSDSPPYYSQIENTYRFAEGVAAGNIAEVGVGWASTGSLFSRARIVDASGNPTTITVLPDESLDVVYVLRHFAPLGDSSSVVTLAGVDHTFTGRVSNAGAATSIGPGGNGIGSTWGNYTMFSGATLAPVTGQMSGTNNGNASNTDAAYVNGTYYRDHLFTAGLTVGNAPAGTDGIVSGASSSVTSFGFQFLIEPPIVKNAAQVLALNFRHSWARV